MSELVQKIQLFLYTNGEIISVVEIMVSVIAFVVFVFIEIYKIIFFLTKEKVNSKSRQLAHLRLVNQMYQFSKIKDVYAFSHSFDRKQSFDNCDLEELMSCYIEDDLPFFEKIAVKFHQLMIFSIIQ